MSPRPGDADGPPLAVGVAIGAHGVHGALRVLLHDPDSEALQPGRTVVLHRDGETVGRLELEAVAPVPGKPGRRRVSAAGLHDRDAAEALRGCELLVSRDQLPPLDEDEYYLADAIGLPVQRERNGVTQALGEISGLTSNGAQDLYEVRWRGPDGRARTWLLPVLPQTIVEMGPTRVLVELPLGMLPEGLEGEEEPG
ncbi:MAG: 16S rRNA processing protein RimM [Myxococcales bacterium]|nr:16S rRNA processing protein RimM [Myxococcales bacterium]MCB9714873.1 16S rRNA processing protein RimM [Myxococcales bacterium]